MTDRERIETMVLRQQAVEALHARGGSMRLVIETAVLLSRDPPWRASDCWSTAGEGDTEADALRALLRDIGVEPWAWPHAESKRNAASAHGALLLALFGGES